MQKLLGKILFPLVIFLYRASGGRIGGRMNGGAVLLLTTIGRKSGKPRTVPVIYLVDGSSYVVTASAGGLDRHPGWFFNLRNNPQVRVQVKNKQMNALAEVVDVEKKRARLRAIDPGAALL